MDRSACLADFVPKNGLAMSIALRFISISKPKSFTKAEFKRKECCFAALFPFSLDLSVPRLVVGDIRPTDCDYATLFPFPDSLGVLTFCPSSSLSEQAGMEVVAAKVGKTIFSCNCETVECEKHFFRQNTSVSQTNRSERYLDKTLRNSEKNTIFAKK